MEKLNGVDVDAETKRLMAASNRDLVTKDIPSTVNAFQEASSLLGKKYGETANQCADAFYFYGMALLELAQMENNVLGNTLEGVPEEEDEESDKDRNIHSASNHDEKEREEVGVQVYDAMSEKDEKANKENGDSKETKTEEAKADELQWEKSSDAAENKDRAEGESA
ncbi:histone-binding protein N1/N2-like [Bufo bufo]|uniref:histone-binding protein N1/N2-like n=1 Tax=Bufo bufo TaxID=8384 RepID=UPI001ABEB335|nr:histone-binding protein N1/N2-like [Bufo bufo]